MSRNTVDGPLAQANKRGLQNLTVVSKTCVMGQLQTDMPEISADCGNDTYPQERTRTRDEQIGPYLLFDTVRC